MRTLLIFLILLINSICNSIFSCSYYPYGEDIRFTLLKPDIFEFKDFSIFNYSSLLFNPDDVITDKDSIETSQKYNIELWRKRCDNIPSVKAIYEAIYLNDAKTDKLRENSFIQYLYKKKDLKAIKYIDFAKDCSKFNAFYNDPWERNEITSLPQRTKLIKYALDKSNEFKDNELKLRYSFIAIRLAYYNNDYETIKMIYDEVFASRTNKNIIDYWSMYFRALAEPSGVLKNYLASQVFTNAPDKRFMIQAQYDENIPVNKVLSLAKNNQEKSAVWLLAGIKNSGRALESLQNIAKLEPNSAGLSFLLIREINKLEDWIFTPYYTHFNCEQDLDVMQNRVLKDRNYARQILNLVNSMNFSKVNNQLAWQLSKIYLLFITESYSSSIQESKSVKNKYPTNSAIKDIIGMFEALSLTAQQSPDNAIILDKIKPVMMHQHALSNMKFLFAIAKELEYKGNLTDAAILLSKLNFNNETNIVYWKTRVKRCTLYSDYYVHYFNYLDAIYTPQQIQDVISAVQTCKTKDKFDIWKYSSIKNDIPRLFDLIGTKYLRNNDLSNALASFKMVNDSLWTSSFYYYKDYLDANPFYTNMYNEHTRTEADTITYNKRTIVSTLLNYLKKAETTNNKKRDYFYFLVANCYFNMTQYGNSWMMRRYYWTSRAKETSLEDDEEYFNCTMARNYYLKAKETTKNKKFAALCIRMAGRCENYRLLHEYSRATYGYINNETYNKIFKENTYYAEIKQQYPQYYDDLISNCESFGNYFNAR